MNLLMLVCLSCGRKKKEDYIIHKGLGQDPCFLEIKEGGTWVCMWVCKGLYKSVSVNVRRNQMEIEFLIYMSTSFICVLVLESCRTWLTFDQT